MTTKNFVVKNGLTTGNIVLSAANSNVSANYVVANLQVPNSANLGAVGNIIITGGVANYVLSTDGTGNLSWVAQTGGGGNGTPVTYAFNTFSGNGVQTQFTLSTAASNSNTIVNYNGALQLSNAYTISGNIITMSEAPANGSAIEVIVMSGTGGGGSGTPGGSNTQVQFNDSNTFAGSSAFTFDKTSNVLSVTGNITSTNANLGNLVTANYITGTLTTQAQPNITSLGSLSSLTVSGLITATSGGIKTANVIDSTGTNTISVSSTTVGIVGNLSVGTGGTGNITTTGLQASGNVTLGSVANVHISGGSANYVLSTDGSGNLSWKAQTVEQLSPFLLMGA